MSGWFDLKVVIDNNNFNSLKAYVYPNIEQNLLGSKNPYISNLKTSLKNNGFTINPGYSRNAFLNLLKKGFSSDCLILNWVEDIPSRRFALGQMIVFYFFVLLCRLRAKKIIWIKHNKISHNRSNWRLKKVMQSFLIANSNLIVTHATDAGLDNTDKLFFLHHPNAIEINEVLTPSYNSTPTIDFLIWGSIIPYKGLLEFLKFVNSNDVFKNIKIHIVGKCDDLNYLAELNKYKCENILLENKFVSNDELKELYSKSRFILFTYQSASVMSSGTLIESLISCKRVIGPQCGAFTDLQEEGFVTTYKSFEEIIAIYKHYHNDYILKRDDLLTFIKNSSWLNFGSSLKKIINSKSGTSNINSNSSAFKDFNSSYIQN